MVMEYESPDRSGTDEYLPPLQNHFSRGGNTSYNGRLADVGRGSFFVVQNEAESQIHHIEKEAYCSVLHAFKAQSDDITWEKESLITDLRKELRVSNDEHRELLSRVNDNEMIGRKREWRKAIGLQASMDRVAPLPLGDPSPALLTSTQSSLSVMKHGSMSASRGTKHKPFSHTVHAERTQAVNRGSYGAASNEHAEGATNDPYIGKKVRTRWPEDGLFYEATVTGYDPLQGKHILVYNMHSTGATTWEYVNLNEIPPEDIHWESEEPGASRKSMQPGSSSGTKIPVVHGVGEGGAGRGHEISYVLDKSDFSQPQNGIGKKSPGCIELLHTEILVNEVDRILNASQPDPMEIQKAKRLLKEQERGLVDALAMLEDISDGESGSK